MGRGRGNFYGKEGGCKVHLWFIKVWLIFSGTQIEELVYYLNS